MRRQLQKWLLYGIWFKDVLFRCHKLLFNPQCLILAWLSVVAWHVCRDYPTWQSVCVLQVIDGDTLHYELEGSNAKLIGRLWHVDAFERQQSPWGNRSSKLLENLLLFHQDERQQCRKAYVKKFSKDQYGRNLILIKRSIVERRSINEQMLQKGWALIYPGTEWPYRDGAQWKKLQEDAKWGKQGIWKYPKADWISPWSFRKKKRSRNYAVFRPRKST